MAKITLGRGAVKVIHGALDRLFDRLKARVLGQGWADKRVVVGMDPDITLGGLFRQASVEERNRPNLELLDSLERNADGYIEAQRVAMKTKAVHAVESYLREAETKGVDTDMETVLGGELMEINRKVSEGIHSIVDTEATHTRNQGTLDGILKVNAASGIEDPTVFFIVVRDSDLCEECRRLHLLPSGKPRLWKLSQLGHGYHKRGDDEPKIGGLHPHCRCSLGTLLPGYGFNDAGMVTFIDLDHDEYDEQSDDTLPTMKKAEPVIEILKEEEKVRKPLLDGHGNIIIGNGADFKKFSEECNDGVFVSFKGFDANVSVDKLADIVQRVVKNEDLTGRIFLSRKKFQIFVSDRDKANKVIGEIQKQMLDEGE